MKLSTGMKSTTAATLLCLTALFTQSAFAGAPASPEQSYDIKDPAFQACVAEQVHKVWPDAEGGLIESVYQDSKILNFRDRGLQTVHSVSVYDNGGGVMVATRDGLVVLPSSIFGDSILSIFEDSVHSYYPTKHSLEQAGTGGGITNAVGSEQGFAEKTAAQHAAIASSLTNCMK